MDTIKLVIADDQKLFLRGIRFILDNFKDIEIVGEALNGQELVEVVGKANPHVVLSDIKMPDMDGIEATKILKQRHPDIKVILLTMYNDDRLISHVMELGANGYLLKDEDAEEVHKAIQAVYERGFYFNDYVSKALLRQIKSKNKIAPGAILGANVAKLTPRELEVLDLICREYSTTEIAEQLFISARTVEGHRKNLLEKTGVRNVAGLVIFAIKHELVDVQNLLQ